MWRLTERLHTCEMRSACERHTMCFYTMFATHTSTSDKQYPIAKMSDASEKPQANVHCPHQWNRLRFLLGSRQGGNTPCGDEESGANK